MSNWGEGAPPAGGAPVTVPRDAAHDAARQELLNPAYHRHDPSLTQRVMDWLGEQLDHALAQVGSTAHGGAAGLLLFLLVAVAIGAALWWRLGAPRREARSTASLFETAGPRTAAQHRTAAAAHAAAAEWGEAVREQMRALVRALEERTLLDSRPGRTADEAAAEAGRALPAHSAALGTAARTFDDIAFGERTADQAAYRSLVELDQALEATKPVLTPAAGGAA
ncbi:DUF4129 domain-containing protein [Kitasatospora sp. MAP5-34]|uniref:DUF4129 domain-containing protein n=1 Tax=Kitasatospora sp. MAP5-34 TaxID=3035102 RepID=UPI002474E507|nr:DUF4129 domain-containing protein [Kitasatospora sp. MAP5-34]MDH6577205.1 hypothetical protein [Kitasatospora sp. MAP5-34]